MPNKKAAKAHERKTKRDARDEAAKRMAADRLERVAAVAYAEREAAGGAAAAAAPAAMAAGAGVELNTDTQPSDVDLPIYPGAAIRRDKGDDGNGLSFSLWGGSVGFLDGDLKDEKGRLIVHSTSTIKIVRPKAKA